MRKTKIIEHKQGATEECRGVAITLERLEHLPEKELDKLIKEEPYMTIKDYRVFLLELNDIKKSTENESDNRDNSQS